MELEQINLRIIVKMRTNECGKIQKFHFLQYKSCAKRYFESVILDFAVWLQTMK